MARIEITTELCKGCAICAEVCPAKIISLGGEVNSKGYSCAAQTDTDGCTGCKLCALVCPDAAIEVYR